MGLYYGCVITLRAADMMRTTHVYCGIFASEDEARGRFVASAMKHSPGEAVVNAAVGVVSKETVVQVERLIRGGPQE